MKGGKQERELWANLEKDQGVFNAKEIRRDGSVDRRRVKLEGVARSGSVRRLAPRQNFRFSAGWLALRDCSILIAIFRFGRGLGPSGFQPLLPGRGMPAPNNTHVTSLWVENGGFVTDTSETKKAREESRK
jgi:hypothetical protein